MYICVFMYECVYIYVCGRMYVCMSYYMSNFSFTALRAGTVTDSLSHVATLQGTLLF